METKRNMKQINVTKRDGTLEPFDPEKVHKVAMWACEDLTNVSASQIQLKLFQQLHDKITSTSIHEKLIQSAVELITEATPNYQWVAARLRLFQIRKIALGQFEPIPLIDLVARNIKLGLYTPELAQWYTAAEFDQLDKMIKHDRDFLYSSAGMEQLKSKYLVQNRRTKQIYETPQYANILIAATIFHGYPQETRMATIKEFYDELSTFTISLPTPIMSGVRTRRKQFSSCVKIKSDDTLASIGAVSYTIMQYVSQAAGIGIDASMIRGQGAEVDGGEKVHTGVVPFFRTFESATRSCSQGGVRNGAATLFFPLWHWEIENVLVLKNNKGTEETRVRGIDYAIQTNQYLKRRMIQNGHITLFDPSDVPELYEAFFSDQDLFARLYEEAERKTSIRKKRVSALDLMTAYHKERKETGRIYQMNVDNVNNHGPFNPITDPIYQSNLCVEVALPTKPLQSIDDEAPAIALCTLAAVNLGDYVDMGNLPKLERRIDLLSRALNELLDYQNYPVAAARNHTMKYRPLGIGVTNLAYWLAAKGYTYSKADGLDDFHRLMEAFQYYAIKSSVEQAKEHGPCPGFYGSRWEQGLMPVHRYAPAVDELVDPNIIAMDWDWLSDEVMEHGVRNTTNSALMPVETSSQISNSTNGIEAPRSLVTIKGGDGEGSIRQVVPHIQKLKNKYELLWDQPSCEGYLKYVAIAQKFVDQSISANTFYNPENYENGEIPMQQMLMDDLKAHKWGIKTLYYCNTYDGARDTTSDDDDEDAGDLTPPPMVDDDCDSCKL